MPANWNYSDTLSSYTRAAVIHIRGTPASGKSIMAKLLCRHYASRTQQRIVFVTDWKNWLKNGKKTVDFLVRMCHFQGYKTVRKSNFLSGQNDDLVFILDEAQITYDDPDFWYSFIKERLALENGPRFCIFTSYGSPTTGTPDYPKSATPPILKKERRISLIVPHYDVGHNVCLFFHQEEFNDVVRKRVAVKDYTISQDVEHYIFSQTNGHPGIAEAMLRFVDQFYRNNLKRTEVSHVTYSHVGAAFENDDTLLEFLASDVVGKKFSVKKDAAGH